MNNFKDYYFRRYAVRKWSFQNFFCIFVYFLIFAVPFYFAFGGRNFWFEEKFDLIGLEYSFTGLYALQLCVLNNSTNTIYQFSNIPSSSMQSLTNFNVNFDDNTNNVTFQLTLNSLNATDKIQSINGAIFYNVKISTFDKVLSVPYFFTLKGDTLNAYLRGQMKLSVSDPINALTSLNTPTINPSSYLSVNLQAPSTYQQIIEAQAGNPYQLSGQIYSKVSQNQKNSISDRTIKIFLQKDTNIILPYYPSILESLKFHFSQYVGFLILAYIILSNIMLILIKDEGLQCNVKDEAPPLK